MIPQDTTQSPIDALIQRAREGDDEAWEELVRHYQPKLKAWARHDIKSSAPQGLRVSDITQEAMLKVYQHIKTFKGSNASTLGGFLRTVVRRAWLDEIGRGIPGERMPLDSSEIEELPAIQPTQSQLTAQWGTGRRLITALFQLDEPQRESLATHLLLGVSQEELMERSGRSAEAQESLLRRARNRLDEVLEKRAEAESRSPHEAHVRNQLDAALSRYFRGIKKGVPVDPEAFAKNYAECADELVPLLRWLETLRTLVSTS